MVVDKDVGKGWVSGHWEKSKQSGYVHLLYCSSDGRIKPEGMSARLADFLCTGRIMIGAGLDMVCWGISNTLLASLNAHDSSPSAPCNSIFVPPSSFITWGETVH